MVLGRDAPQDRLEHWLGVAAGVDGFVGFAIGRSIWEQPLTAWVKKEIDRDTLVEQVRTAYRHYAEVYLRTSRG